MYTLIWLIVSVFMKTPWSLIEVGDVEEEEDEEEEGQGGGGRTNNRTFVKNTTVYEKIIIHSIHLLCVYKDYAIIFIIK